MKKFLAAATMATMLATTAGVPEADARRPGYRHGPVGAPTGHLHSRSRGSGSGMEALMIVFWIVIVVLAIAGMAKDE